MCLCPTDPLSQLEHHSAKLVTVQSSLVVFILLEQKKQPKIGLTQQSLGRGHVGSWPPQQLWRPALPHTAPALGAPALPLQPCSVPHHAGNQQSLFTKELLRSNLPLIYIWDLSQSLLVQASRVRTLVWYSLSPLP